MDKYLELKNKHTDSFQQLNTKFKTISLLRLIVFASFLFLGYKSFSTGEYWIIALAFLSFVAFVVLMRIHKKVSRKRKIAEALVLINEQEISYLNGTAIPFENGEEFIDYTHFYTYDLDVFGNHSLFHHLNRTATFPGKQKLSSMLQHLLTNAEISENQVAIEELKNKVEWRQDVLAYAKVANDSKKDYDKLIAWTKDETTSISGVLRILFFLIPTLFVISLTIHFFRTDLLFFHIATGFFLFNLLLAGMQMKRIKNVLIDSDHITTIIRQYSAVIDKIESQKFTSTKLQSLQQEINYTTGSASKKLKSLHVLLSNAETIQNGFAAIFFNGSFLYHIHNLVALIKWKQEFAKDIEKWLLVLGSFEALNSLANYAYNNQSFVFPGLNDNYQIKFKSLGHPLINASARVCNDLSLQKNNFIILTGSNMSGKSTFLRTLGVNMVMAGIGAPVCASEAMVHPLPVLMSMRQMDSLNDGESYFFAEVKRLKKIMDRLGKGVCFVLLDEILKGTNSDDKQTGTIEVIKKVISKGTIGCIATHDLEVCQTTDAYPEQLRNKCFEVEIIDNELAFDYTLRNGVCQNKSATFIMKKEAII